VEALLKVSEVLTPKEES
jgi:hypothetical protein